MKIIEISNIPIGPVYHGTNSSFNQFHKQKRNPSDPRRLGFYFTTSRKFAGLYGDKIITAKLHISNIYDISDMTNREIIKNLPLEKIQKQILMSGFGNIEGQQYGLIEAAESYGITEKLRIIGYDSIRYIEGYSACYIVFSSDDIEIID
jgi:hypothetical protein